MMTIPLKSSYGCLYGMFFLIQDFTEYLNFGKEVSLWRSSGSMFHNIDNGGIPLSLEP